MSKTTNNWKSSFAAVRDRFGNGNNNNNGKGNESDELHSFAGMYTIGNGGQLSSQTLPRYRPKPKMFNGISYDEEASGSSLLSTAVKKTAESMSLPRRNDLGNFWLKTVVGRAKSPIPSPLRLTAAEHLEQLHEPLDEEFLRSADDGTRIGNGRGGCYRQQSQLDSVATRRNIYLRETARSQSPNPLMNAGNSERFHRNGYNNGVITTTLNIMNNTKKGEYANAENVNRNGCGRFPTVDAINGIVTTTQTPNYPVKNQKNNNDAKMDNQSYTIKLQDRSTVAERSPSPDTLSDISQSSLLYLPHPRPKHNIHEQMLIIMGNNNGYSTKTISSSLSATNFPSPNSNSVAMRVSALEKHPGMPKFLSLAGATTAAAAAENPAPAIRSPKSTVFRTKPIIHLDQNETRQKEFNRHDDSHVALAWRSDTTMPSTVDIVQIGNGHNNSGSRWPETTTADASQSYYSMADDSLETAVQNPFEKLLNEFGHINNLDYQSPKRNGAMPTTTNHGFEAPKAVDEMDLIREIVTNPCVKKTINQKPVTVVKKNAEKSTNGSWLQYFPRPAADMTPPPLRPKSPSSIAGKLANIKRFHYPFGTPVSGHVNDAICERVHLYYDKNGGIGLDASHFGRICELINFPVYVKRAVYEACGRLAGESAADVPITYKQFSNYWKRMTSRAHDEASRFIFTLAAGRPTNENFKKDLSHDNPLTYIISSDFNSMMMDVINTHPGLHFLKTSPQFHSRYCEVVIVRIFWEVNRSWTGRITPAELRRSTFLSTLRILEQVTDINKVTEFFSYEHFYVTYCKFWELDTDHDMIISRADMREHGGGALTDRIIDRIFSAAVIRRPVAAAAPSPISTMGFENFVMFILAEEDKRHPTSIEYWFRCIDLDGDGVISLYEMEYFYSEIEQKLSAKNMETLCLTDVICNLLDSVAPARENCVTRTDLKRSGLAHRFFNTFVNYVKYLDQESSEGERASVKASGDREISDWETFCAIEYELLMMDTDAGDDTVYVNYLFRTYPGTQRISISNLITNYPATTSHEKTWKIEAAT